MLAWRAAAVVLNEGGLTPGLDPVAPLQELSCSASSGLSSTGYLMGPLHVAIAARHYRLLARIARLTCKKRASKFTANVGGNLAGGDLIVVAAVDTPGLMAGRKFIPLHECVRTCWNEGETAESVLSWETMSMNICSAPQVHCFF